MKPKLKPKYQTRTAPDGRKWFWSSGMMHQNEDLGDAMRGAAGVLYRERQKGLEK